MAETSMTWRERVACRLAGPVLTAIAALLGVLVSAPRREASWPAASF